MPNYISLDTWALQRYTFDEWAPRLSKYLRAEDLTILLTSFLLVELFSPDWQQAPKGDKNAAVSRFLSQHQYVIVDPSHVFRSEMRSYPAMLAHLPVELSSESIPSIERGEVLLRFLRRDPVFLEQGKDIELWAAEYRAQKDGWLDVAQRILDAAYSDGKLIKGRDGKPLSSDKCKEPFLQYLDLRHLGSFTSEEREALGPNIIDLCLGGTAQLPAVRCTSLSLWYSYVEIDPAFTMKYRGSDIGDYLQMSLMPYCAVYVADKAMARIASRVLTSLPCTCEVHYQATLDERLMSYTCGS